MKSYSCIIGVYNVKLSACNICIGTINIYKPAGSSDVFQTTGIFPRILSLDVLDRKQIYPDTMAGWSVIIIRFLICIFPPIFQSTTIIILRLITSVNV